MRRKIDQPQARKTYSRRLGIVEPVFANLRTNKGLDHFTYRGQEKVNTPPKAGYSTVWCTTWKRSPIARRAIARKARASS